jgi:hypothetical protein
MMKKASAFLVLTLSLAAAGCNATPASTPTLPITDLAGAKGRTMARTFGRPKQMSFEYSQLFMWKKDSSPTEIANVLEATSRLEAKQDEIFVLNQERKGLKSQLDAVLAGTGEDIVDLPHDLVELPGKLAQLDDQQKQLDALKKQVSDQKRTKDKEEGNRKSPLPKVPNKVVSNVSFAIMPYVLEKIVITKNGHRENSPKGIQGREIH